MKYLVAILFMFQIGGPSRERMPPPLDVPPISEEYGNLGKHFCDMGFCTWVDANVNNPDLFGNKPTRRTRPTCADKKRFLMTSEDGIKHCIKIEVSYGG